MKFTINITSAVGREPFRLTGLTAAEVMVVVEVHLRRAAHPNHIVTITPEF
jgi:hypothetical protein